MTAFMAGDGSPKVTRLRVCSIGASVPQLREPSLFGQSKLRKSDRAGLLFDHLNELNRSFDVDDVGPIGQLAVEQFGFDHGGHTTAAADQNNSYWLILAAQFGPVRYLAKQDLANLIERGLANRVDG